MAKSKFWRLIAGYESSGTGSVGKRFTDVSFSGAVNQRTKRSMSFRIQNLIGRISDLFSYTSTKSYGALSLTFGILTLIFHFSGEYFGAYREAGMSALIIGIVFSMLSIPLLLIDKPLSMLLQDFAISDFILFDFFCLKRAHRVDGAPSVNPLIAACLGMVPALIGVFVPIRFVLIAIALLTFVYLAFVSPEFSYIFTLIALPYVFYFPYASYLLFGVICVTLVSFLRKVAYGKRVLHIEQYDILIALFVLALLISGIFVKGVDSFVGAFGVSVLSLGYILTSNIVTNRRLADCAINAVILSSIPAAIIALYEFLSAVFSGAAHAVFSTGVSASFSTPDAYAVYLLIVIALTVTRMVQSRGFVRFLFITILFFNTGALVFTAQRFALLVLILGVALFFAYRVRYVAPFAATIFIALPYILVLCFGDSTGFVFASTDGSLMPSEITELWTAALEVLSKNAFIGIGIGDGAFAQEFLPLGFDGIKNSHNFFIELGLEAGAFALVAVLLLLAVRFRHRATYQRYLKESDMSLISTMTAVMTSMLIIFGATNYLFESAEITYLFWFVFGLGSAALRVAKHECDDRVLYYEDAKSPDFSVAEIKIK